MEFVSLPDNATNLQKETYNKNAELYHLAWKNLNRYGMLNSFREIIMYL